MPVFRNSYAIIGRGFCGVLNHTTLLRTAWGRGRIAGRPVVYIGRGNPWNRYKRHLMGQAPSLLTLPGFSNRLPADDAYLWSNHFADYVQDQFSALLRAPAVEEVGATVQSIQRDPAGGFLLTGSDGGESEGGAPSVIGHADYVDICTGLGEPKADLPLSPDLELDRRGPLGPSRRVFSGEEFLDLATPAIKGQEICVIGGGPTSALCCERALDEDNKVVWMVRSELERAFPLGERFKRIKQLAAVNTIRVGEGYTAERVRSTNAFRIKLRFRETDGKQQRFEGNDREGPLEIECDRIIIATGHRNEIERLAADVQWRPLEKEYLGCNVALIPFGDDENDPKLRVLGSAAVTSDSFSRFVDDDLRRILEGYTDTLPLQVRLPHAKGAERKPNFSVAVIARLVGEANRYFEDGNVELGPNWNCAFSTNISHCLQRQGIPFKPEDVDQWCRERSNSVGPMADRPQFGQGAGDLVYHCHAQGAAS